MVGLFAISLMAALIFGRVYCGYVCPMNTLMISVEWLSKKLKLQTKNTPKWLKSGYFAWIALVVSAAAMLISKRILHINLSILPIWLVISVLITLIYKPVVFHNLICPFGALQRTFGKFARLSKRSMGMSVLGVSCVRSLVLLMQSLLLARTRKQLLTPNCAINAPIASRFVPRMPFITQNKSNKVYV